MEIGIPLTVAMTWKVDGNPIDKYCDIRAVIRVKPAEEDLIRFTAALVLSNEETRHQSKDVAGSRGWPKLEILLSKRLFRGCGSRLLAKDVHLDGLIGGPQVEFGIGQHCQESEDRHNDSRINRL